MKIKDLIFKIENLDYQDTLELLTKKALSKEGKTFVVTINPELVMLAKVNSDYEKILQSADLALADGIGVIWAGKIFGKSFKGRVQGVDLVEKIAGAIAKQPITVGFLGGKQNVAQKTAECLTKKYPGLNVAFALEEWNSSKAKPCDILFVAFGSPKQEFWIRENLSKHDIKVAIGVGGAFDFISGTVPRAPIFIRNLGLEWLFRLTIQPWRIKRQINLIKFILLVLGEKVGLK